MQISVVGAAEATGEEYSIAYETGRFIAQAGATLVCGGLFGVMEAACRGAREAGGRTVGIVPGTDDGNAYLDAVIRTGLGQARNVLVVQSGDAVIAIGGNYGTLSEIAIALKTGRRVFGIKTWDIPGVTQCVTAEDAVTGAAAAACELSAGSGRRS